MKATFTQCGGRNIKKNKLSKAEPKMHNASGESCKSWKETHKNPFEWAVFGHKHRERHCARAIKQKNGNRNL
jgi:hypothetical protein